MDPFTAYLVYFAYALLRGTACVCITALAVWTLLNGPFLPSGPYVSKLAVLPQGPRIPRRKSPWDREPKPGAFGPDPYY